MALTNRSHTWWTLAGFILATVAGVLATGSGAFAGKDLGPVGACDAVSKGSAAWRDCVGSVAQLSDQDLFYAGYWLARLGRYDQAIAYLAAAQAPDSRTLTYLGFATRKAGDVTKAFSYYRKALALDPDNVVARAYMGEAYVTIGDIPAARGELAEIAQRCGANCAAYEELARHIARGGAARG
jgi:tetratricopeptide (TPR) repeat protein